MRVLQLNLKSQDSNLRQLFESADRLIIASTRDGGNIRELAKIVRTQNESIDKLAKIAVAHDRLDSNEGGAQQ